jgi:pimeloyl-ACP methyl ester carboxylesterase
MPIPGRGGLDEEQLTTLLRNRQATALFGWKPFLHNPKLRRRLARIDVPTLVVWGESDGWVNVDYGRAFARAIPGARFELVEQAGHFPYLEQPDAFVATLDEWLVGSQRPLVGGRA